MTEHALVSPGGEVMRLAMQDALVLPTTKSGWAWMEVNVLAVPEYDPLTERLQEVVALEFGEVARRWDVVELGEKDAALAAADDAIKQGYLVEPEGYRLALGDGDRNAFTGMLVLLNALQGRGVITDSTAHPIKDKDDGMHEITTERFRVVIEGYGVYWQAAWAARSAALAMS